MGTKNKKLLEARIKKLESDITGGSTKFGGKKIEKYNSENGKSNGVYNAGAEMKLTQKKKVRQEDEDEEIEVKKSKKKSKLDSDDE